MPNSISATGLTTATRTELIDNFTTQFQDIYGADINLESSTPDGQLMNIFVQAVLDTLELISSVNAQFDPDEALGVLLDQRVAINGIQRQAGTYTITNVTLTASQALTLNGLDDFPDNPYTVADNAGNNWLLLNTQNIASPGNYVYAFRAENTGAVLTMVNTITVPVSVVLGINNINNPTTYTTLGIKEETDADLKVRRQRSVSLSSQGYAASLKAALDNINGITFSRVNENYTDTTDGDGVPSHSIWVIVQGGNNQAVAQAIYQKRNAGCGMFGSVSVTLTQADGSPFVVKFDVVSPEDLFIKFTATSIDGINAPDIARIRATLPETFVPGVYERVNINDLATQAQLIDENCLITNAGFSISSGGSYSNTLLPTTKADQFVVSSPNIIILPMILSPATATVPTTLTQQFTGLGGYGTLTYSISVNNSGGSINSSTGLYTAGATIPVTDTILCVDSLANSCTALAGVTA